MRDRRCLPALKLLRPLAFAVLAALAAPDLWAQVDLEGEASLGAPASIETSTSAGVLVGAARELVLDGSYKISELDWSMKPLVLTGSELRFSMPTGLRASIRVRAGVPGYTGRITDKDFLNWDGAVTHYSEHQCFTEGALLVDARVGWHFPIGQRFALEPFGGLSVMRLKWTARDGYLQYPPEADEPFTPWNPDTTIKVNVYGTGIIYQQTWYIPQAGVRVAYYRFGESIDAALALGFSPYLVMFDLDNHELRLLDFEGNLSGGWLLDPSLSVSWRFSPRVRLSFDVSYRLIRGIVGDTIVTGVGVVGMTGTELDPGERAFIGDSAGASFDALGISISLDVSL